MKHHGFASLMQARRNIHVNAVLILAILAVFSVWPAISLEPITDAKSCQSALRNSEDALVRAAIGDSTFQLLNDQLATMSGLCAASDFIGAQIIIIDVMNALEDLRKPT